MNRPQVIIMLSGALLIFVGIGLVIAQMIIQVTVPGAMFPSRSLGVTAPGATATVQTTYVGLVMIVIGAVLEIVGYVSAGPWKHPPRFPPSDP